MTAYPRCVALALLALLAGCERRAERAPGHFRVVHQATVSGPILLDWDANGDSVALKAGRRVWIPMWPIPEVGDSLAGDDWTTKVIAADDSTVTFAVYVRKVVPR